MDIGWIMVIGLIVLMIPFLPFPKKWGEKIMRELRRLFYREGGA